MDGPARIRSILVLHQGALGDFILSLPSLAAVRKTFPGAELTILGYPDILELAEGRFYAERILSIDQGGMASFFVREGQLDRRLSRLFGTFHLVIVFSKDKEGILIENLKRVCQGRILQINPFPPEEEKVHLTDHLFREFWGHGFQGSEAGPKLFLKESDRDRGNEFWANKGVTSKERSELIILHPGSGSKKKTWPWERFSELIPYLQKHLNSRTAVISGPAEGNDIEKRLEQGENQKPFLIKGLSILQVASVLEGCRLFIGNDSGVSHLAAALGLPTLAIFGPTDPEAWAPRGEKVVTVRSKIPCSPCSKERFYACQDAECLKKIGIEDVLEGVEKLGIRLAG